MARPLIPGLVLGAACALASCLCAAARAQALPDPTRPPAPASTEAAGVPTTQGLVLQSVMMKEGRPVGAIISGQLVAPGATIRGARLARLSESQAVLVGAEGETVLPLTPGIHKQSVHAAGAHTPRAASSRKH